jgi:hypothetical protein
MRTGPTWITDACIPLIWHKPVEKRWKGLAASREHQDALLSALSREERDRLADLLLRIADQQGLVRGVHPGYQ